jgi:NADH-quinone oxidoreductase subunit N
LSLQALAPEVTVFVTALVVVLLGALLADNKKGFLLPISALGVIAALIAELTVGRTSNSLYGEVFLVDPLAVLLKVLLLVISLFIILISFQWIKDPDYAGEYFGLILFATLGMMIIASSGELTTVYVSLGLVGLALYALVARSPSTTDGDRSHKSKEAGIKYILLGMLSAAVLLYGLSILYGLTGTLVIKDIYSILTDTGRHPALMLSLAFILLGLGFKIGMVPFHVWVPDTYEGAPTPVTALLAIGSKTTGFALMLRVFVGAFAGVQAYWVPLAEILAILTMFVGNLIALSQSNIKRLLAYSSIAHGGYILVGVVTLSRMGISAVLFYLLAYAFTSLCAFTAIIVFSHMTGSDEIKDYAGLHKRAPGLALAFSISLLSLAGIPLFVGFDGKFYVFAAAVNEGFYGLVILALINSAISLYYYLRIIKDMYVLEPSSEEPVSIHPFFKVILWAESLAILVFGIFPSVFFQFTDAAARSFLAGL